LDDARPVAEDEEVELAARPLVREPAADRDGTSHVLAQVLDRNDGCVAARGHGWTSGRRGLERGRAPDDPACRDDGSTGADASCGTAQVIVGEAPEGSQTRP